MHRSSLYGNRPRNSHSAPSRIPGSAVLSLCLLALCPAAMPAAEPMAVDIAVQSVTSSQAPRLVGDVVLFGYKPAGAVRFVGARFGNEGYAILHTYTINDNGVFVLDYELPEGVQELRYRMVVDGLWMADPSNSSYTTDELGNTISVFTIAREPVRPVVNPKVTANRSLLFTYKGESGMQVSIAGDFNDWDPFIDYFAETTPGTYQASIRVLPGEHFYYFYLGGRRILDPSNPQSGYDPSGNEVSYFLLSP